VEQPTEPTAPAEPIVAEEKPVEAIAAVEPAPAEVAAVAESAAVAETVPAAMITPAAPVEEVAPAVAVPAGPIDIEEIEDQEELERKGGKKKGKRKDRTLVFDEERGMVIAKKQRKAGRGGEVFDLEEEI